MGKGALGEVEEGYSDRRLKKSSSRSEIGPASKERRTSWETGLAGGRGGWAGKLRYWC
jgi:hypothetical protein